MQVHDARFNNSQKSSITNYSSKYSPVKHSTQFSCQFLKISTCSVCLCRPLAWPRSLCCALNKSPSSLLQGCKMLVVTKSRSNLSWQTPVPVSGHAPWLVIIIILITTEIMMEIFPIQHLDYDLVQKKFN